MLTDNILKRATNSLAIVVAFCVSLMGTGCTSDHFTIEGTVADGGTQNVRVVYPTDDGFECEWVTMKEGHFAYRGESADPVVVSIYNQQKKLIAHALVSNGDDLEFTASLAEPWGTVVKGTKVNEQWSEFIVSHSDDFANDNRSATDAAIEEYVAAHPASVVSTLLLMCEFSDLTQKKRVDDILAKIEIEARPESVMRGFYAMQAMRGEISDKERVSTMTLWSDRDSMENVRPYSKSMSIYYFWTPDDRSRSDDFRLLKSFAKELDSKRLQIIDIDLDSDTLRWKSIVRGDSASWQRYWAVGGVTNSYLRNFNLSSTPYYVLSDSTGRLLYHGDNFATARQMIEKKLKK